MTTSIPHLRVVVAVTACAILGYAVFSVWVFGWTEDAALRGDVVGTWKSFAVGGFAFWIGASSGGKLKDGEPTPARIVNTTTDPVPTAPVATSEETKP